MGMAHRNAGAAPPPRARTRRARAALLGLACAGLLLPGACRKEAGPEPVVLTSIDRSFQPLRRDFESARNKVRLVGLLAPTCGSCQDAVRGIVQQILPQIGSADLEVFCIWISNVPPDVEVRARALAQKARDPRIRHYWDDSGRIGRAFGRQVGMADGQALYDAFYLYGRGDTWDAKGTMATEPAGWNALMNDWQPAAPRARWGGHPHVRMPAFDPARVREQVRALLESPSP